MITITAVYYTANANKEWLQKAVDAWNEQSGKYEMVVGKVDDKKSYTVNFDLTIVDFEDDSKAQQEISPQRSFYNYFTINDKLKDEQRGIRQQSMIKVRTKAPHRTIVHEIGHSLGIGEGSGGVMISGGDSDKIRKVHIRSILNHAGATLFGSYWGNCDPGEDVHRESYIDLTGKFKRKKR